jgi:MFS family permease
MHGPAVIPDDQIIGLPFVPIHASRLSTYRTTLLSNYCTIDGATVKEIISITEGRVQMTQAVVGTRRGWYQGWNIVAACVLSQAVANGLPVNAFSLFLQDWSAQLHAPISFFQLGLAALGVVSAFGSPWVGVLADKYPARWLLGGGLLSTACFCIGVSVVTTSWQLLALFTVLLPVSVLFSSSLPANAVVARWFVRRLGLALGLTAFGLGLAGVILPPIVAAIMPVLGWRVIWRGSGIFIALIVAPVVMWVVRDRPADSDGVHYVPVDNESRAARGVGHGSHPGNASLNWRGVLGRRTFWLLVAVFLPILGLYGGCGNNLAPIASSQGLSRQTAGVLLSALSLAHVASTLLSGLLSDRFGNRFPLAGLAMTAAMGGFLVAFGHGVIDLGIGVVLVGLGGGMWPLLAAAVAREFGARGVGRAFGLLMMFLPVIVLMPFAVAKVHEVFGSYAPALAGLAGLTLLSGTACMAFMRERRVDQGGGSGIAHEVAHIEPLEGSQRIL